VPFVGHSAKAALPRAALDEFLLSVTSWFNECRTLGIGELSAKRCSAKVALGKGPSAAVLKLTVVSFCPRAEGPGNSMISCVVLLGFYT
jgi:hypothetical protein